MDPCSTELHAKQEKPLLAVVLENFRVKNKQKKILINIKFYFWSVIVSQWSIRQTLVGFSKEHNFPTRQGTVAITINKLFL